MRRTVRALCMLAVVLSLPGCWAAHPKEPDAPVEEGYPDTDLARFAPASHGMVWASRNYDARGNGVGNEMEELESFTDGPIKTRRLHVSEDIENSPSQFSTVIETLYPDRIESVTEETGRFKVLLHTPIRPGTTWTNPRGMGAGEERRSIVAIENVCTAWGYFPQAVKVLGMTLGPRPNGGEPVRLRTEEWFVRDVGRVQVIARVDGKPELEVRSVLEHFMDPQADTPFEPAPCPSQHP